MKKLPFEAAYLMRSDGRISDFLMSYNRHSSLSSISSLISLARRSGRLVEVLSRGGSVSEWGSFLDFASHSCKERNDTWSRFSLRCVSFSRRKGVGSLFKIEQRGQPRCILHEDSRLLFNPDVATPTTVSGDVLLHP